MIKQSKTSTQKPHHGHDLVFRKSLSDIVVARGFVDLYMRNKIKRHLNLDSLQLEQPIAIDKNLKQSISDVVYSCEYKDKSLGRAKIVILVEHQSTADKFMPVRVYHYLFGLLINELSKRKNKKSSLLPACYAIVFYHGEPTPYPYSLSLDACIDDPKGIMKAFWQKPVNLVDVGQYSDDELLSHQLEGVMSAVLKHSRKKNVTDILYRILDKLVMLDIQDPIRLELINIMIGYMLGNSKLEDRAYFFSYVKQLPEPIKGELMTFADELRKEGEEIGLAKGQEIGIAKGQEIGIAKGQEIGIAKGQEIGIRQTAINALKQGIAPKDVANFSGLSLQEVTKLAVEYQLH